MPHLGRESEREAVLAKLEAMPAFLENALLALSPGEATVPGPGGSFSPVEQCWHLADLEREGYGERVRRLLTEVDPFLPDFDGDRVATERHYRTRPLDRGLQAFREARSANLSLLRSLQARDWERRGRQEGVGAITLGQIPEMMAAHDTAHQAEIQAWLRERSSP